jgi:hypothetical protein
MTVIDQLAGNMNKSVYDTDSDNIVDNAEYDPTASFLDSVTTQDAIDEVNLRTQQGAGFLEYTDYTDNEDGTVDMPATEALFYINSSFETPLKKITVPIKTGLSLTDQKANFIVADYNSGTPQWDIQLAGPGLTFNGSDCILWAVVYRDGNEIHPVYQKDTANGQSEKANVRAYTLSNFAFNPNNGLALSEQATRVVKISAIQAFFGNTPMDVQAFQSNTSGHEFTFYKHVAGVWTADETTTQYNNTQYDDGTDLVSAGVAKYIYNDIYRGKEEAPHTYYVLGRNQYNTLTGAENAPLYTGGELPEIVDRHAQFVGRIVVVTNASSGTVLPLQTSEFVSGVVANHDDTSNISGSGPEYYHPNLAQYTAWQSAISTSGVFTGNVSVATETATTNLAIADINGGLIVTTNAITLTLPAVSGFSALGAIITIQVGSTHTVSVDCNASDKIVLDGVALDDGDKITSSGTAGDQITLINDSADGWRTIGRTGTWTDGG